jgi:hypothetical protein
LLVLIAIPLAAGSAVADPDVGCGLGTEVWEGSSGMIPKLAAGTTNQWLGTQSVGISLGTSGCSQGGVVTAAVQKELFVAGNFDSLTREMAVGEGEALDTLASLMEIEEGDRAAFSSLTQSHFAELVPSVDTTVGDLLSTLDRLMESDATLARYVQG